MLHANVQGLGIGCEQMLLICVILTGPVPVITVASKMYCSEAVLACNSLDCKIVIELLAVSINRVVVLKTTLA